MFSLYAPLQFSLPDKQIRLLRLEPSPPENDGFAFSMQIHDFEGGNCPSYVAISYTWGLPIPLLPVIINGLKMHVRLNCWYALWQMRNHGHTSNDNFWIDSLCINQSDENEKNHQVAIMGKIYSAASWVAASLGTGESLGNVRRTVADGDDFEIAKLRDRFDQLPYFDRAWIKQEVVLAKDITLFYGLEKLCWEELHRAVHNIARKIYVSHSEGSDSGKYSDQRAFELYGIDPWGRSDYSSENSEVSDRRRVLEKSSVTMQLCNHRLQATKIFTFMDLIVKYRTSKASIAADKIYALLPLLPENDPIRQRLPITYGQETWFPLFCTLTRLLYSSYPDEHVGNIHTALSILRDSLQLNGLDEEVKTFLQSSTPHPWNSESFDSGCAALEIGSLDILYDQEAGKVSNEDFRVDTTGYAPLETLVTCGLMRDENAESEQDSYESSQSNDECPPEWHIPSQLKSLRTLYSFSGPKGTPLAKPAREEKFLVNCDVQPGDLLASLVWDASKFDTKDHWPVAYVILRRLVIGDEDSAQQSPLGDEAGQSRTALVLHSWAVPVCSKLTILSRSSGRFTLGVSSSRMRESHLGQLKLHYRDALIPLLLNRHPLQSLLYSMVRHDAKRFSQSSRLADPGLVLRWLDYQRGELSSDEELEFKEEAGMVGFWDRSGLWAFAYDDPGWDSDAVSWQTVDSSD